MTERIAALLNANMKQISDLNIQLEDVGIRIFRAMTSNGQAVIGLSDGMNLQAIGPDALEYERLRVRRHAILQASKEFQKAANE